MTLTLVVSREIEFIRLDLIFKLMMAIDIHLCELAQRCRDVMTFMQCNNYLDCLS